MRPSRKQKTARLLRLLACIIKPKIARGVASAPFFEYFAFQMTPKQSDVYVIDSLDSNSSRRPFLPPACWYGKAGFGPAPDRSTP
jgi:hypothetical protein